MKRQFASTELQALENNALAIENAITVLKDRLAHAPQGVANDVLQRCDPDMHAELIDWLEPLQMDKARRVPRLWSPKRNRRVWMLYQAADLDCPSKPPRAVIDYPEPELA